MKIYLATEYEVTNLLKTLQAERTSNENRSNFLACPAVRDSLDNVFCFSPKETSSVTYSLEGVSRTHGLPILFNRKPHLENTNIFNLYSPVYLFCEESVEIKVTAPYFSNSSYQTQATFMPGVFNIGRWFRGIHSEIVTWNEKGLIEFKRREPLFYVEFLTKEKIEFEHFKMNPVIEMLASGLVNSPFQVEGKLQGTLEGRYQAFENSDYRKGLIEEIKAALVSNES